MLVVSTKSILIVHSLGIKLIWIVIHVTLNIASTNGRLVLFLHVLLLSLHVLFIHQGAILVVFAQIILVEASSLLMRYLSPLSVPSGHKLVRVEPIGCASSLVQESWLQ